MIAALTFLAVCCATLGAGMAASALALPARRLGWTERLFAIGIVIFVLGMALGFGAALDALAGTMSRGVHVR
ncbi:hypothetical protein BH10PSE13_BH10PSE13_23700 [soil metagenome]